MTRETTSKAGRPKRSPSITGVKVAGDRREGVVEHRHLEEEAAGAVGMVDRQLQGDVGAERGAADHRRVEPEVVEQGDDLAGEQRHRVEAQVLGPVGAAVAEQVDADRAVAALGQRRPQPLVHAAVHQQPVDEDDRRARPRRSCRTRSGGPRSGTRPWRGSLAGSVQRLAGSSPTST